MPCEGPGQRDGVPPATLGLKAEVHTPHICPGPRSVPSGL